MPDEPIDTDAATEGALAAATLENHAEEAAEDGNAGVLSEPAAGD